MDTSELMEKIEKGFTGLRADLGEQMEKGFKKVGDEFTGMRGEFTGLRDEFTGMRGEFTGLREEFTGLRGEFTGLREEFTGLRGEFTGLRGEFSGLRGEFTGLRGDFTGLRGEFDELQTNVAAKIEEGKHETKVAFEALRHDLKIFDEDSTPGSTITLARRVTSLEGRVKNLEKAR